MDILFEFYRGDTYTRDFVIIGWEKPIDKVFFTVKENINNKKACLQKTLEDGITLVDVAEDGSKTYNLLICCTDTDNLKVDVDYTFDIEIHTLTNEKPIKKTIATGILKVKSKSNKNLQRVLGGKNMASVNFSDEEKVIIKVQDDINYIPAYKVAEEERRKNEIERQKNELERENYYEDIKEKVENGEFDGKDGVDGADGQDGEPNVLTIGEVVKGEEASATITGDTPNQVLNLVLPKGDTGEQGIQGQDGKDATINGSNILNILAGENITLEQNGENLTINSTGGGEDSGITLIDTSTTGERVNLSDLKKGMYVLNGTFYFHRNWTATTTLLKTLYFADGSHSFFFAISDATNKSLKVGMVKDYFNWGVSEANCGFEFVDYYAPCDNLTSEYSDRPLSANQGKLLSDMIGVLTNLTTTDKTSLVNAINELASSSGGNGGIPKLTLDELFLNDETGVFDVIITENPSNEATGIGIVVLDTLNNSKVIYVIVNANNRKGFKVGIYRGKIGEKATSGGTSYLYESNTTTMWADDGYVSGKMLGNLLGKKTFNSDMYVSKLKTTNKGSLLEAINELYDNGIKSMSKSTWESQAPDGITNVTGWGLGIVRRTSDFDVDGVLICPNTDRVIFKLYSNDVGSLKELKELHLLSDGEISETSNQIPNGKNIYDYLEANYHKEVELYYNEEGTAEDFELSDIIGNYSGGYIEFKNGDEWYGSARIPKNANGKYIELNVNGVGVAGYYMSTRTLIFNNNRATFNSTGAWARITDYDYDSTENVTHPTGYGVPNNPIKVIRVVGIK